MTNNNSGLTISNSGYVSLDARVLTLTWINSMINLMKRRDLISQVINIYASINRCNPSIHQQQLNINKILSSLQDEDQSYLSVKSIVRIIDLVIELFYYRSIYFI